MMFLFLCLILAATAAAIWFQGLWSAAVSLVNPAIAFAVLVGLVFALVLAQDARWGLFGLMAIITLLPFAAVPLNVGFSPTFLDLVTVMSCRERRPHGVGSPDEREPHT